MRLFDILKRVKTIKEIELEAGFYFFRGITIKILSREKHSYISIFLDEEQFICSFLFDKNKNIFRWETYLNGSFLEIDLEEQDFTEEESYLILKHGKSFDTDYILKKLGVTFEELDEMVSNAITQHESLGQK